MSITIETIEKHIRHCSIDKKDLIKNKLMILILSMIKYNKYSCKDHNKINNHIKYLHHIDFILLIIAYIYPNPLI